MEKRERTKFEVLNLLIQPYSFAILKELEKGPKRFSELSSKRITSQKTLSDKLKRLREYGLVDYASIESKGGKYANAYQISEFGKKILRELRGIGLT